VVVYEHVAPKLMNLNSSSPRELNAKLFVIGTMPEKRQSEKIYLPALANEVGRLIIPVNLLSINALSPIDVKPVGRVRVPIVP